MHLFEPFLSGAPYAYFGADRLKSADVKYASQLVPSDATGLSHSNIKLFKF